MGTPRKLSLFDATMLVMGGIIGVGIFFNPHRVALLVPGPGAYFLLWILGGLAALAGAMTFAELSGTFPRTGGWYVFLREGFGSFPAFLFACIVLFVVSTGAAAAIADFSAQQIGVLVHGPEGAPLRERKLVGAAILVGVSLLGALGLKTGALFQNLCMVLKLAAIATFVVAGFALWPRSGVALPDPLPAPPAPTGHAKLAPAFLHVLFSYGGWQLVSYIAPKVKDPERTLPKAIVLGVAGVLVVYLATNQAYLHVLGLDGLRTHGAFAAELAHRTLGEIGGTLLVAAMAISSLGIVTAILITTPGLYVAMAEEGLFVRAIGREHPRTGAPLLALALQCAIALAYFSFLGADELAGKVVFAEWIFHCLVGLALLRIRKLRPDLPRPFRSWAYPLFPVLYSAIAAAVVVGTLVQAPLAETAAGLGVVAAGSLIYLPWRALARRSAPATGG